MSQIKTWAIRQAEVAGKAALVVETLRWSAKLTYRCPISSDLCMSDPEYQMEVLGRGFSPAAAAELKNRARTLVAAIRHAEQTGADSGAAILAAAGAAIRSHSGPTYSIRFARRDWYLWGTADGGCLLRTVDGSFAGPCIGPIAVSDLIANERSRLWPA